MLVWQEIGDLIRMVTLGSCNRGVSARALRHLLSCPRATSKRLVARLCSPAAAGQQAEPFGQPVADLLGAQGPSPDRRQLDPQGQPVEAAAQVHDRRLVRGGQLGAYSASAGGRRTRPPNQAWPTRFGDSACVLGRS